MRAPRRAEKDPNNEMAAVQSKLQIELKSEMPKSEMLLLSRKVLLMNEYASRKLLREVVLPVFKMHALFVDDCVRALTVIVLKSHVL